MLLRWLANRRWNKRRLIFRFHDGRRIRRVDPVEIALALHEHPEYLPEHLGEASDGHLGAQRTVAQAACDVFGVQPLSEKGGLTVAERIELMQAFDLYLLALKKNTVASRISRSSTASTSAGSSATTTNATSDSGSTASDPPSAPPKPSDSAS